MTGDAPYQMTVNPRANTVRLRLAGEIDIAVTDDLRAVLEASLADRPDSVEIDFREVTFMDSTGIRFLVGVKSRCDAIGASWSLVNVSPPIARLIDLSGLSDFLHPPE